MEIEVKLRLPNKSSHQKLLTLLSPFHVATHRQRNAFFDGPSSELGSRRAVLRLRSHNDDLGNPKECFLCLKSRAVIANGVSRVEEDEEKLDPLVGKSCLEDPRRLMDSSAAEHSRVMRRVREEFGIEGGLVFLGSFENVRNVYEWEEGLKLEVDEVRYEFGHMYEIECESLEPEKAKEMIGKFLKANAIEYSDSVMSKFAIFRAGKLP